jgi:hypothetical protein
MNDYEILFDGDGGPHEIDWVQADDEAGASITAERLAREEGYGPVVRIRPSHPIQLCRSMGGGHPMVR